MIIRANILKHSFYCRFIQTVFYVVVILCVTVINTYGQSGQLVKRSVAVLPFYNLTKNSADNSFTEIIYQKIITNLTSTNNFVFISSDNLLKTLDDAMINYNDLLWEEDANRIAELLKADVVIYGFFAVTGNNIKIYTNVLDGMQRRTVINRLLRSQKGNQFQSTLTSFVTDFAELLSIALPPYERSVIESVIIERRIIRDENATTIDMDQFIINMTGVYPLGTAMDEVINKLRASDLRMINIKDNLIEVQDNSNRLFVYLFDEDGLYGIFTTEQVKNNNTYEQTIANAVSGFKNTIQIEPTTTDGHSVFTGISGNTYTISGYDGGRDKLVLTGYFKEDRYNSIENYRNDLVYFNNIVKNKNLFVNWSVFQQHALQIPVLFTGHDNIYRVNFDSSSNEYEYFDKPWSQLASIEMFSLGSELSFNYYPNCLTSLGLSTSISVGLGYFSNILDNILFITGNFDILFRLESQLYAFDNIGAVFYSGVTLNITYYTTTTSFYENEIREIANFPITGGFFIGSGFEISASNGFYIELLFFSQINAGGFAVMPKPLTTPDTDQTYNYTGQNISLTVVPIGIRLKFGMSSVVQIKRSGI